jgi:molybdopterin-guanine dinucleotide biosynthesis protein A
MKFSAALFAGGQSHRMGRDKADVLVGGIPLWQRQTELLRETGADEIFVSGSDRTEWRDAGLMIVTDETPAAGPLGGLVSTLRRSAHPFLLVLAVDMPSMTSAFLKELIQSADAGFGAVPKIGERYEPLAALYPTASLALAEDCLARAELALQAFVSRAVADGLVRERVVEAHEHRIFFNLNTPGDLTDFATQ